MYTAPLPMEMSLTTYKCVEARTVSKVGRIHRGRGKAAVCNISTAAYDRAY